MKVDVTKLEAGLEALTGYDFENAEKEARAAGDTTPDISFSKNFQARLAATASGLTIDDIKALKINEYVMITTKVSNFLLGNLAKEILEGNSKK